jgi:hypothetical protein
MQQELFPPTVVKVAPVAPGPGEERTDEIAAQIIALVKEWGHLTGGNQHLRQYNEGIQTAWKVADNASLLIFNTFRNLGRIK